MTDVLLAAVLVLTAFVLVDFALTLAVIRRLRLRPADAAVPGAPPDPGGPPLGAPLPQFAAEALDGTRLDAAELVGRKTLIAFFATSCTACADRAPGYVAQAEALRRAGTYVLTVLQAAPGDDPQPMSAILAEAGTLIVQPGPSPVLRAFAPRVTPSFFLADESGRVAGKGVSLAQALPQALPAPVPHG